MFPKIDAVVPGLELLHKSCGVGEPLLVPNIRAGIGVRLPSWLQPENVAWNFPVPELLCERDKIRVRCIGGSSIPEAETPLRRVYASS